MQVGSLVELVNDNWPIRQNNEIFPVKGIIYTVRSLGIEGGIHLEEIVNQPNHYIQGYAECEFKVSRFKELQPPIDISMLLEETIKETV